MQSDQMPITTNTQNLFQNEFPYPKWYYIRYSIQLCNNFWGHISGTHCQMRLWCHGLLRLLVVGERDNSKKRSEQLCNPQLAWDLEPQVPSTPSDLFLTSALEEMASQEYVHKSLSPSQTLQVSSRTAGASFTSPRKPSDLRLPDWTAEDITWRWQHVLPLTSSMILMHRGYTLTTCVFLTASLDSHAFREELVLPSTSIHDEIRAILTIQNFLLPLRPVGRNSDPIKRPEFFSEPLPWLCCQPCLNIFLNNSLIQKDFLPHHPWTTRPFNDYSRFWMVLEHLFLENLTLIFYRNEKGLLAYSLRNSLLSWLGSKCLNVYQICKRLLAPTATGLRMLTDM